MSQDNQTHKESQKALVREGKKLGKNFDAQADAA